MEPKIALTQMFQTAYSSKKSFIFFLKAQQCLYFCQTSQADITGKVKDRISRNVDYSIVLTHSKYLSVQ